METKYLIDTNIFIKFQEGQQYDKNCFPTHFSNFLELLDNEVAVSIDKVRDELVDEYFCVEYEQIFKNSINNELTETYNDLRIRFPKYFNEYALNNPDDADPFIITYAYHNNLCIVTQDEYLSTADIELDVDKYNIPTLCDRLGATCIDNKDNRENSGSYTDGFGCICLTELIKIEEMMK